MDLTRGERLQIMLTEEELKALDDWRFARRMPSRAAAVRELLKRGLLAEGIVLMDGRKSQDFGVTANDGDGTAGDGDGKANHGGDGKADHGGDGKSQAKQA